MCRKLETVSSLALAFMGLLQRTVALRMLSPSLWVLLPSTAQGGRKVGKTYI
jgi:hypothetical protein